MDFIEVFNKVHGFISINEANLLYQLASEVPLNGIIVEIGSFQGRSTIALGLGARVNGARVYTIDPHEEMRINDTQFGMSDHAALLKNLVAYDLASIVRLIDLSSQEASQAWFSYIDLAFIDGWHSYTVVNSDFQWISKWSSKSGKIAMHDTSGHYPDVTRALDEILAAGQWDIVDKVDATSVLARVK